MVGLRAVLVVLLGVPAVTSACGRGDERVVVFAASSLTDVFAQLEVEFESANPDVDVVVTTGGSSSLVAQLLDGAPVDVLATADPETMDRAIAGLPDTVEPIDFARNELVIAVERGNPLGIDDVGDLAAGPIVVLAAVEVPAGRYARSVLRCADVEVEPASYEQSVRAVAAKVRLGEADAGIVYRTDIEDRLDAVELPAECQVDAEYPLLAVTDTEPGRRFMAFITSSVGDDALDERRLRAAMTPSRHTRPRMPIGIVVLGLAGVVFFLMPFVALLARAPWGSIGDVFGDEAVRTALALSVVTSIITTALAVLIGVPLAWLLGAQSSARPTIRTRAVHALDGVAAGRGRCRAVPGARPSRRDRRTARRRVRRDAPVHHRRGRDRPTVRRDAVPGADGRGRAPQLDPANEEAARTLGASEWYVFRRVTLPADPPCAGRRASCSPGRGRSGSSGRRSRSPGASRG